jgi:hypothetical protein
MTQTYFSRNWNTYQLVWKISRREEAEAFSERSVLLHRSGFLAEDILLRVMCPGVLRTNFCIPLEGI